MGANNNKNQQQGGQPNPGQSGNDPRGRSQNQIQYQQNRYEGQQNPLAESMSYNYGRGSEADYGNMTDMMNNYRDIYANPGGSGGSSGGGGGGGGGGGYSAFTVNPQQVGTERASTERATTRGLGPLERVQQSNPYESYGGMKEFSTTGGYSGQDINNMRARGMSPIRAAYANAERNIGQQRSLQGGYSPNAIAAQAKMAREQGQSMADAGQNVEAGIADMRNKGRLAGLQGMGNIEQARQQAQMQGDIFNAGQANEGQKFDIGNETQTSQFNAGQGNQVGMFNAGQGNQMGQFNADMDMKGQMYNADANTQAQARNNAAAAAGAANSQASAEENQRMRLAALNGASNLYGTTPGASKLFGDQATGIVGQSGNMGLGLIDREQNNYQIPGAYEQGMGRASDFLNMAGRASDAIYPWLRGGNQQPTQGVTPPAPSFRSPSYGSPGYGATMNPTVQPRRPGYGASFMGGQ